MHFVYLVPWILLVGRLWGWSANLAAGNIDEALNRWNLILLTFIARI
jgi:hypothetical protein